MKLATNLAATLALVLAAGATFTVGARSAPAPATTPASHVDDFQLTDHKLMAHQLYYYKFAPAIVLMSRGDSDYSRAAAAELERVSAAYRDKGVQFFMVDSTPGVTREAVAARAAREGLTLPVLVDEQQLVGESLGVQREGEVFVIQPKGWTVAYHGPLDDRFAKGAPRAGSSAAQGYTTSAIDAVLSGAAPAQTWVQALAGKAVAFPERMRPGVATKISYTRDVAPILQEKCSGCHLAGGIGPFAMDSYEIVKGFSPMIRETVRTRRMPPYYADPHIGAFKNDQGLTAAQTRTLVHWIEAGAPRGDGPDPLLANKGKVAPEWPVALGKPDVIVEIPAFQVPARGMVEYQNQKVDNPFKENTWLRAISVRPGDRRALHHMVSNYVPVPGAPAATIPGGSVGSYTPGADAQVIAPGAGAPVPAGGKLNFQMHYTTFGKETTDKTQVGFYTMKEEPKYIKRSTVIGDFGLYIPAGEARHKEIAYLEFPADAYVYTLYPHAHYRGMHVELKSRTPDGKEKMLIALPKYDFNWQRDYDPVEPILVKAGTKLIATWVYDNSANNPANPDPKRNVTWGEQTPDEMMYFRVNYRWADETVKNVRNDIQAKLESSRMIGAMDDDFDGKISLAELRGPMSGIKAQFAKLDKNGDGKLDRTEMVGTSIFSLARRRASETPDL